MNSRAPSTTISPNQVSPHYLESAQRRRPELRLVHSARPNAAVDPIVAADSNVPGREFTQWVIPTMGTLGSLTMNVAEELESVERFLRRFTEEMVHPSPENVFISTWMADAAPIPPIETLADQCRAAIEELVRLAPGWDGYHGVPVLPGVAEYALRLLEAIGAHTQIIPDVVPLSIGGLQLEWYIGIFEIEVEIAPDCATRLHRVCTTDGSTAEVSIDDPFDLSDVAAFFRELRR